MYRFLRISSAYPDFIKNFEKKKIRNLKYDSLLKKYFKQNYSVSNYITEELKKKKYKCFEIVSNFDLLQNKWLKEFGNFTSNKEVILQQIEYYKPNIVFIGNADIAKKKLINEIKALEFVKHIFCFHCAPLKKNILENLEEIDTIVTCTEGYKKFFQKKLNKKALLIQHSFPKNISVKSKKRDIDITFIGSIFLGKGLHDYRVEILYALISKFKNNYIAINFSKYFFLILFLEVIKSIFKLQILKKLNFFYKILYIYFNSKTPIFGTNNFEILSRSKILINTHIDDTKYAGNMRLFEGTGLGCMMITDSKRGLKKLFKIGKEIVTFKNTKDLINKCNYYLSNDLILKKIAQNGKNRTLLFHNYEKRIKILNNYIKKI